MWIMEKRAGQWPSLAPTNSILLHINRRRSQIEVFLSTFVSYSSNPLYMWIENVSCTWWYHLGTPKNPPFRAPRQEADTRIGINEDRPLRARLAKVCSEETVWMYSSVTTHKLQSHGWSHVCQFDTLSTNQSHSIRHEQIVCRHHCIVSNVDQHVTHRHCHHWQDDCQWDVSVNKKQE